MEQGKGLVIRFKLHRTGQLSSLGIPHHGNPLHIIQSLLEMDRQLLKAGGRIDGNSRYRRQKRHIENTLMGLPVIRHYPGPVHRQHYMAADDGGIIENLIIAALQEGGINRKYRQHPILRQSGSKSDGVLLCDAHVKEAVRELLRKILQPGTAFHGGGNGADSFVFLG